MWDFKREERSRAPGNSTPLRINYNSHQINIFNEIGKKIVKIISDTIFKIF